VQHDDRDGGQGGAGTPDDLTRAQGKVPDWLSVQEGASYLDRLAIDLSALEPLVARPHRVDDVVPARELGDVRVDQVFIGTCTNGRLQDLQAAAEILRGRRIASGVRMIIIPASRRILKEAPTTGR